MPAAFNHSGPPQPLPYRSPTQNSRWESEVDAPWPSVAPRGHWARSLLSTAHSHAQEVTQKLFGRGRPLPGQKGPSLQAAEKYRAATGLMPLTPKADPRAPCAL